MIFLSPKLAEDVGVKFVSHLLSDESYHNVERFAVFQPSFALYCAITVNVALVSSVSVTCIDIAEVEVRATELGFRL